MANQQRRLSLFCANCIGRKAKNLGSFCALVTQEFNLLGYCFKYSTAVEIRDYAGAGLRSTRGSRIGKFSNAASAANRASAYHIHK